MTKNNYNAKHIELGKKFLANENVNIDLDDDRLTISINVEDRIWTDGSSIWSKGVVKGVKVGGIVLNAHKMEDNYWDGGLLGNVDYDGSGKDGTWYDGVDDESALINRNTSAESDGLIYSDSGFIKNLIAKPEMGKIYKGKVVKIMEFGAFVNFYGKRDGLVHVSQISEERVNHPKDVLTEGQNVKVKLMGIDDRGKSKLSMKVINQSTGKEVEKEA